MEWLQENVVVQLGALGILLFFAGLVIKTLYKDLRSERTRNNEYGERVLTALVESTKATEADTKAKEGLIDRFDRMARP